MVSGRPQLSCAKCNTCFGLQRAKEQNKSGTRIKKEIRKSERMRADKEAKATSGQSQWQWKWLGSCEVYYGRSDATAQYDERHRNFSQKPLNTGFTAACISAQEGFESYFMRCRCKKSVAMGLILDMNMHVANEFGNTPAIICSQFGYDLPFEGGRSELGEQI